jgi:hypothetical protein
MEYHYSVLESVLTSIAKDQSDYNIRDQISRLTSDERRKLNGLLSLVMIESYDREIAA